MRVRTKTTMQGPFVTLKITSRNTGTISNSSQMATMSASTGETSTMEDSNNGSALRLGGIVNTPCRLTRVVRTGDPAESHEVSVLNSNGSLGFVTASGPFAGSLLSSVTEPEVDVSKKTQIALIKAFAEMNSSVTLGGEALATLGQTVDMIRRPLTSLQDLIIVLFKRHQARKARLLKQKRKRDSKIKKNRTMAPADRSYQLHQSLSMFNMAVSNSYLQIRYGMFPLMWDVEGAMNLFAEEYFSLENNLPAVIKVARGGSSTANNSFGGSFSPQFPYLNDIWDVRASYTSKKSVRVSAGVIYEIKPSCTLDRAVSHFGLRIRDIPSTMWELLPFSFVIDWAINVGDWLQAVVPVPNIRPVSSWTTTVSESDKRVSDVSFKVTFGWGKPEVRDFSFGGASEKTTTYERLVDPSLSQHPLITGEPLSNLRIADSAAIAAQRVASLLKNLTR